MELDFPLTEAALRDADDKRPVIGVLALQGDVAEHIRALENAGASAVRVRTLEELNSVDGLVLPGGESTAIMKLLKVFNLVTPLRERIKNRMPVYGSCAGMILLADHLANPGAGQETIGGMDVVVRRNAFGRQVDSFEVDLDMAQLREQTSGTEFENLREFGVRAVAPETVTGPNGPIRTVFIRAPWIESAGPDVQVLARIPDKDAHGHQLPAHASGKIVAARRGGLLVTAFHPEVTGDNRVHELFVDMVKGIR